KNFDIRDFRSEKRLAFALGNAQFTSYATPPWSAHAPTGQRLVARVTVTFSGPLLRASFRGVATTCHELWHFCLNMRGGRCAELRRNGLLRISPHNVIAHVPRGLLPTESGHYLHLKSRLDRIVRRIVTGPDTREAPAV